jgi:hypothetical protein
MVHNSMKKSAGYLIIIIIIIIILTLQPFVGLGLL